jgi:hypothetical protein
MVVGKGYFVFPVIQYMSGEGKIVWPADAKEVDFQVPPYYK